MLFIVMLGPRNQFLSNTLRLERVTLNLRLGVLRVSLVLLENFPFTKTNVCRVESSLSKHKTHIIVSYFKQ